MFAPLALPTVLPVVTLLVHVLYVALANLMAGACSLPRLLSEFEDENF